MHCLWLGPEMVARLGGLKELESAAIVVPVGKGYRVEFDAGMELGEVERLVEPLLAGHEEWERGWMGGEG